MIHNEIQSRREYVLSVAGAMMAAARTAPKGRGMDNLEIAVVTGEDIAALAGRMRSHASEPGKQFYGRDADNVEAAQAVVLIGTHNKALGLNCGMCGHDTCTGKPGNVPCGFNLNDMGIALGSAVAIAADSRIDSRIMLSAGRTAKELGLLEGCHAIFAIPLSCTGKNPFFDRPAAH